MNYLPRHKKNVIKEISISKNILVPGSIVIFNYIDEDKKTSKQMTLVLNPIYQGNLHGLAMEAIKIELLQKLVDIIKLWYSKKYNELLKLRLPLVKVNVGNPKTFYTSKLKPLLKTYLKEIDCYREFHHNKMTNVKIVEYKFNIQDNEIIRSK